MPIKPKQTGIYRFCDMELDAAERLLLRNGSRIALTPRMFDLLLKLIEADGHLLSKETLLNEVWADAVVEEGNLNRTVSALRKALGEAKGENRFIETVPKNGYRFVAKVECGNGAFLYAPEVSEPTPPQRKSNNRWIGSLAFALLLILLVGGYFLMPNAAVETAAYSANGGLADRLTNNEFDEDAAMWTDDGRIRFIRFTSGAKAVSFVMNADGSDQKKVGDEIEDFRAGTWSPDGRKVLFTKENGGGRELFLANADGSGEIKLPFPPGPMDWSPDSKRFVFNADIPGGPNDSEIFIYTLETKEIANVSNSRSFDANPAFSPDGRQIAFNSDRDGNAEIYIMNADGSGIRRLTENPAKEAFHVFSPDGTQLAFNSNRENEKVAIYLLNVNDSAPPVKISDTAYNAEIRPGCWSRDGTKIVFTSDKNGGKFNVYTMPVEPANPGVLYADKVTDMQSPAASPNGKSILYSSKSADGSGELRLLPDSGLSSKGGRLVVTAENANLAPAWSPDGETIAFNCKIGGNTEICSVRQDGTELLNLTQNPAHESEAAWSPDGREIIFSSDRDGSFEKVSLFRMNADGSGQRRVLRKDGYEMTPAWSPDGRNIAFAGDRGDGSSKALDIFLINLANPEREQILSVRRFHDSMPAFSPDGARIVFVSQSDGNSEIYIMNTDGSGLLRLTRNIADDLQPGFSHDGKKIIFSSNRNGKFALFEILLFD